MRKWFTCLFTGLWLFASLQSAAQTPCTFTGFGLKIQSVTAAQGQQICLDVTTQGFTNMFGMQFGIQFDPAVLEFVNVSGVSPSPLAGLTSGSFNVFMPGKMVGTWNDPAATGMVSLPDGTVIFQLCFNVIGNATTMVSFFGTPPAALEAINGNLEEIPFGNCPGTVTVGGGSGGPSALGLTIANATAAQGAQVCLGVTAQNFTDLTDVQFSMQYNSAMLTFVNATNFSLSGLTGASFSNPTPGVLTMNWDAPGGTGVTRPNGTVIFELCFTVTGNMTSTVGFAATPLATEIINASAQMVSLNGTNGTVTVSGGGGSNCNISGFGLEIESADVTQGQQVCLDVIVHGFTNILGMQFSINYNPAVLQFVNISGISPSPLNGLVSGSFGTGTPGVITALWESPTGTGVTLANDAVIFQVCFNVLSCANTTVSFSDNPTPIEITDGNINPVNFNSCPGVLSCGGGGTPTCEIAGFGLEIESADVTQGQQVCLDVIVHGFTNILGMQFSINYNPAVLQFVNISGISPSPLNGLVSGSFGTGTPGVITALWESPTGMGVTLANDAVIFQVCFNVLSCTNTTVSFSDSPTPIEITDGNINPVIFNSCPGVLSCGGGGTPTCEITGFGLEIESTSAMQGEQICLDVTTHGFTDILGMQFSMNYNPAVLQFVNISGVSPSPLAGLSTGQFGTGTAGIITVVWDSPTGAGITLPNVTIFQVCFNVLTCANTTVTFSDNPTPIEITDGDIESVPFNSCAGVVSCGTQQQGPTISGANIVNVACRGANTGSITVNATGSGTLTYTWSANAQAGNTPTITNRMAGTYSVTITSSAGGTPATATYMITQPATSVTINSVTPTNVSCNGEDDGSILVAASGGTGTLSYAWSSPPPAPGNTPNPMNLIPFSFYRVTVTDANGCMAVSMLIEVEEPDALVVTAGAVQNVLCGGASTGSLAVNVTGGTPPFSYDWSGTAPSTNPATGLAAGTYSVTVTDSRNCTKVLNNLTVMNMNPPVAISNTAVTDLNNGNPGAINITVQGGNNTYTYSWTGPGGFTASTEDISNLAAGGQYCVTVTDGNGCTANTCATVAQELSITTFTISKACSGSSNGGVDITISGGTMPFTYEWRNSANMVIAATQDLTNVAPGTYNVIVTDGNNNQVTGSFDVTSLPAINIVPTIGSATSGNNGSISLAITGGAPGYTVNWSPGNLSGASISSLAVGQYCATITDQNGCTATGCYMVTAQPFAILTTSSTDALCNGDATGTVTVMVIGGSPPFTMTIDGEQYTSSNGTFVIDGLGAGTYPFTVEDAGGAQLTGSETIDEPAAISATSVVNHDLEDAGCTGTVTLNITNGTAPYSVQWNANGNGPQLIGLCEGDYIATIEDANGCTVTLPAISLNTFGQTVALANVDCPNDEDGGIDLTVTGGNAPYTYEWKNAAGVVVAITEDLSNVGAGVYTVRITDANGLVLTRQYTLTAQSNFSVTAQVTSNHGNFSVSCADGTDGSAIANITGQGDFDVTWELGGSTVQVGTTLQNAGPGDYTAVVTDELGCEIRTPLTLTSPPAITLNANIIPISCVGEKNAEIQVFAAGGVPGNYQYVWSNSFFGNQIRFLNVGNYTVTATDLNGCEKVETYTIAEPLPIAVTFDIIPATDGCNGSVRAIVTGGQAPYKYQWLNLNASDLSSIVSSLCPGEYFLSVTDDNGCAIASSVTAVVGDERYPCLEERVVITPDGNGTNDEFIIFCIGQLPDNNLEVYNRWGQLVFETENYDNTWAGTSQNGTPLPAGPYYYVLEYNNPDGTRVQAKGSLTILRE